MRYLHQDKVSRSRFFSLASRQPNLARSENESGGNYLTPICYDRYRQSLVARIKRRSLDYHYAAERQVFPGTVTIDAGTVGAYRETVLSFLLSPQYPPDVLLKWESTHQLIN
jgi:hypothetical protein